MSKGGKGPWGLSAQHSPSLEPVRDGGTWRSPENITHFQTTKISSLGEHRYFGLYGTLPHWGLCPVQALSLHLQEFPKLNLAFLLIPSISNGLRDHYYLQPAYPPTMLKGRGRIPSQMGQLIKVFFHSFVPCSGKENLFHNLWTIQGELYCFLTVFHLSL